MVECDSHLVIPPCAGLALGKHKEEQNRTEVPDRETDLQVATLFPGRPHAVIDGEREYHDGPKQEGWVPLHLIKVSQRKRDLS